MEEESFPRGGSSSKKRKLEESEESAGLFPESETETKKKTKTPSSPTTKKSKDGKKKFKTLPREGTSTGVEPLLVKDLTAGILVLGVIQDIDEVELIVSLPHGISGTVKITNICDAYTQLLQKLTEDASMDELGDLGSLHELFHIGQVVKCKVLDLNKKSKHAAVLSINPKDVNSNIVTTRISQGMVISGVICSKEDHGFVVDLGIKSLTAFLKNKHAKTYSEDSLDGKELKVGHYLDCLIETGDKMSLVTGDSRTINVVVEQRKVYRSTLSNHMGMVLNSLVPGMIVECTVSKIVDSGVRVSFLGFKANIHKCHLQKSHKAFTENEEVKAAILHIHPINKSITLTQLTHLVTPDLAPRSPFGSYAVGDIIEAEVGKVDKKMGVYVKLDDKVTGLAYVTQLSDKPENKFAQYSRGSKVRCRILGFLYTDNVALVTFKQSTLDQKFLSYNSVIPGEIVKCEVLAVHKRGVAVKIGTNIKGFIPLIQLAEHHVSKRIDNVFTKGDTLKCRILKCVPHERRLILTNKKSMLRSQAPVITSYDQVSIGDVLEGFIVNIRDNGVVVVFYNDIKGWVPKRQLSIEPIEYPNKVFYEGQVVKCQVKDINPDDCKMLLSLVLVGVTPFGQKRIDLPKDFQLGKVASCTVSKKQDNGFDVTLEPSGLPAFLPRMQLSDELSLCGVLWDCLRPGDAIDQVVYYSKKNIVVVSRKKSLITAAEEGTFITGFNQLLPDMVVAGVVKQIMEYGLFVELNGDLRGLVPRKFVSDRVVGDPLKMFQVGQSVVAKVVEVDKEKQRFLLSLKMSDCCHGDTDVSIDVIDAYLQDYNFVKNKYANSKGVKGAMAKLSIGDVVMATVTEVNDSGALCELDGDVKGLVMYEHMKDRTLVAQKRVEMVVVYVDLERQIVELACTSEFVTAVKSFTHNKYSKVKLGQVVKSDVILIKDEFAIVMLKGNTRGRLAYVPTRQIYNDVYGKRPFVIGQINAVVVKRIGNDVRACLKMYEASHDTAEQDSRPKSISHNYSIGDVTTGVVHKTREQYVDIVLPDSEVTAHAHISQLADDIPEGTNPMTSFKQGKKVTVKVIGLKEVKGHVQKYLPVSHPKASRAEVEVTLKPSIVGKRGIDQKDEASYNLFDVGQHVSAYFNKVQRPYVWFYIAPNLHGRALCINASDDTEICNQPDKHFKKNVCYSAAILSKQVKNVVELTLAENNTTVTEDAIVKGKIVSKCANVGLIVQFADGYKGCVALTDVSDEYRDDILRQYHMKNSCWCYVLDASKKTKVVLSLRHSRTKKGAGQTAIKDREVLHISQLKKDDVMRGYVIKTTSDAVIIMIGHGIVGKALVSAEKLADMKPGKCVIVNIDGIQSTIQGDKIWLSLLADDTSVPIRNPTTDDKHLQRWRKRKTSESSGQVATRSKKQKVEGRMSEGDEPEELSDDDSGVESDNVPIKATGATLSLAAASTGFTWTDEFVLPTSQHTQSDDEHSEDEAQGQTKKTKKSKHQKVAEKRADERKVYLRERELLDADRTPTHADDFERLVIQSPDSSIVWLRFMAHYLECQEVDKARVIAERALKTISFREEQEKLNVWVAYLNLENMYGDHESLKEIFDRALQYNEPLKVYNQLINIYVTSAKTEAAEQLHSTCLKKFAQNKDVWVNFGLHNFKTSKFDAARKLLKRSFGVLDTKDHAEVIAKFAQMEFKYGDSGHGVSMFENVLNTYPKRTDLWSVYIDMVIKTQDIEAARKLHERLTDLSMSAKKMKFCFKKFVEFEEKYGNEKTVAHVKQKAVQYVENKAQMTS